MLLTSPIFYSCVGWVGISSFKYSKPTHLDHTGNIALVHNGIIENYDLLKTVLPDKGISFNSDTDSSNSNDLFLVSGNRSYELELYFTSGYDPSELLVSVDFCYPSATTCWLDSGDDGYGSLIAQPHLNDYKHAEEKWVPSKAKLTWDGTVIQTSKLILVTPKGYLFKIFDPLITITDPEGNISSFNLKNWKSESFTD